MEKHPPRRLVMFVRAFMPLLLLGALVSLTTCIEVGTLDVYEPVYMTFEDLRSGVAASEPAEMRETGKIYVKDNYLFANELHRGVHVVDNSDPSDPTPVAFIPIPGNVDIAVLDNILYADSYVDLVAIDISSPSEAVEVARIEDAFPRDPWGVVPEGRDWEDVYETPEADAGVVVSWEKVDQRIYIESPLLVYDTIGAEGGRSSGTGGSLARMTIIDPYLYALHESYIQLISIEDADAPVLGGRVTVDWDIETIFPYGDLLFIGSMSGMHIFDISNPASPDWLSEFAHVTSCDPVEVEGNIAYVTLRAGSMCGGGVNRLDIIDISNPEAPELIESFLDFEGPRGLAVDGSTLFVCDGAAGLKVFDIISASQIEERARFPDREVFDVILVPPVAVVVGPDGIDQYNYTDPEDITHLSHLDVLGE